MAKMMHEVPESETVDRAVFILTRVAGKRVLEFGASGPMHDGIVKAAAHVEGVDREPGDNIVGFDLDDICKERLPVDERLWNDFEIIVCGELIEHLANPGYFLQRLRKQYLGVPVLITVPNAFSAVGLNHIKTGTENVNKDHVCFYSYTTLKELLRRYGYTIREHYWYGGPPYVAEGLIVIAE